MTTEKEAKPNERAFERPVRPLSKLELVELLAQRRQALGGSISEHNHRKLLMSRTRVELDQQWRRIQENEAKRPNCTTETIGSTK